jgi:RNA polymerase sigma-70 factor (ECF subfamily)
MEKQSWLAERFEQHRGHLQGVAYRMLGSLSEADDAVQESWLRLSRAGPEDAGNLGGWLTTVVSRVCLDMLRSRTSRREVPLVADAAEPAAAVDSRSDPVREAALADSVGLALLVVLDRLAPAERVAFVLHDVFALPFEQIASIVGRSPEAARQLASRARRRVRGARPAADLADQRRTVEAYVAALRAGDLDALLRLLDPDAVIRADVSAVAAGAATVIRGAEACAKQAIAYGRGARLARVALVDGNVGLVVAPRGRLFRVVRFTLARGRIAEIEVLADPERIRQVELGVLDG